MKRVIVISDTHSYSITELPTSLLEDIESSDVVLHAGDSDDNNFIDELSSFCKCLYAVKGNCDSFSRLPEKLTVTIENLRISLNHGAGSHSNAKERAFLICKADNPKIVVFGHTHKPCIEERDGVTLLNPGSVLYSRDKEHRGSYAILLINGVDFSIEFIYF